MKKKSKLSGKTTSKRKMTEQEVDEMLDRALVAHKKEFKVKVNTYIDSDIYMALNEEAERTGTKYQTLLNKYLRAAVLMEVSEADIKAIKIALGA